MALYCIISEINRDFGRKSRFFSYPLAFDAPVRGPSRTIAISFGVELEWCGYLMMKKALMICLVVSTEYRRVTDGRTDIVLTA